MKFRILALTALAAFLYGACKQNPAEVAVTGITLSDDDIELIEGQTHTLVATVLPDNATNKAVEWSSAVPSVATITDNGVVEALAMGATTITVTTQDGGYKATCRVIVKKKLIHVQSVSLNLPSITLTEGGSVILGATISPANADDRSVTWSASPESVVTVEQDGHNGIVTAVGPGEGTVTVTTNDGGFQASCKVTVEAATINVESVTLDKETLDLKEGETATLTATVLPEDATDKTVSWKSTNPDVATVDGEGNVTAIQAGQASITASSGGKEATCQVTVSKIVVDVVTVNPATLELVEGDVFQLSASVSPAEADHTVEWASLDESVANVGRNDGLVTAVKAGSTKVFARSKAFPEKQAYCEITVNPDNSLKSIELSSAIMTLQVGESRTLTVNYTPSDAANKNVSWTSSNPSVAIVDKDGTVTAFSEGGATITATAEDGGHTATCDVTVSGSAGPMVFYDLFDDSVHDYVAYINGAPDPRNGIYNEELFFFSGSHIEGSVYYGGTLYTIERWSEWNSTASFWLCKDRKPFLKLSMLDREMQIRELFIRDDWFAILVAYPGYEKLSVFRVDYSGHSQEIVLGPSTCSFRNIYQPAMACLPDGTLQIVGLIKDAYSTFYLATYSIPAGSQDPGEATLLDKNYYGQPAIASDTNGDVYIMVNEYINSDSGYDIILYKNGVRNRVIDNVKTNYDGAIACRNGHVYCAISDVNEQQTKIYRDETVLYTINDKRHIYYNDVRPLKVSASGDVFLAMRSDDSALYKNGALIYSYTYGWTFYPYCIIE
ncbi:MAG: Ig-like domain-containing protein [Bacteroidales bacterium]|nr:Ig-like domain-containing protein [Bacteroidales bacterium]